MTVSYISRLKVDLPSKDRPGHIHRAGTEIAPIRRVVEDQWLIEIRTPEGSGFWYEQIEINISQSEVVEIAEELEE